MTSTTDSTGSTGAEAGIPALEARGLGHAYGTRQILAGIDFAAEQGQFVCIVGPSGVGKTTLLRCLSGLQLATDGDLLVLGKRVREPQPGVALVFQDYSRSLMPWDSVLGNVTLPLRANGVSRKEAAERAYEALAQVGLADTVAGQYPWQLSGGMQQRVAIARALAYNPTVLLMDEPFASVDAQTRADLEDLVLGLQRRLGLTVILVTHDIDESVYLSDRIVVLSGSPASVAEVVEVDLGATRDQITTKNSPEFSATRTHVHGLVRAAAAVSPSTRTGRVVADK